MELKPTRLKIKALDENCTRHGVIALDQYLVEGVQKANIEIEGSGRFAVVKLEILLRDVDLEIPGAPEESSDLLKMKSREVYQLNKQLKETEWKGDAENEKNDSEKVVSVEKLEELIEKWNHRIKCKFASAAVQTDKFGERFISHGAINTYNCARELEELISLESATAANSSRKQK